MLLNDDVLQVALVTLIPVNGIVVRIHNYQVLHIGCTTIEFNTIVRGLKDLDVVKLSAGANRIETQAVDFVAVRVNRYAVLHQHDVLHNTTVVHGVRPTDKSSFTFTVNVTGVGITGIVWCKTRDLYTTPLAGSNSAIISTFEHDGRIHGTYGVDLATARNMQHRRTQRIVRR